MSKIPVIDTVHLFFPLWFSIVALDGTMVIVIVYLAVSTCVADVIHAADFLFSANVFRSVRVYKGPH